MTDPPPPAHQLRRALVVLTAASAPAIAALSLRGSAAAVASLELLAAALLAVAAGGAAIVSWRARGHALDAWVGAALCAYGVLLAITQEASLLDPTGAGFRALQAVGVAAAASGLWVRAHRDEEIDAAARPGVAAAAATAGGVALTAAAYLAERHHLLPSWTTTPGGGRLFLGAAAAIWLAAAAAVVTTGRRRSSLAVVPVMIGAAEATRSAGGLMSGRGELAGAALIAAATSLALVHTAGTLGRLLRYQDRRDLGLRLDLDRIDSEMREQHAAVADQLHDLRNAVGALRSADTTLRRHAERLDPRSRTALADAVSAELARLQVLIEPGRQARAEDFDVEEALRGVLNAERAAGAVVVVDLRGLRAYGDPDALAQVVQNLLVNSRRYAPGATVTLTGAPRSGHVELLVGDTGPGVPEPERARVFLRGTRGSTATGTAGEGLGLHVAARLMAASGGSLRMVDGPTPGACFLLELPAPAGPGAVEARLPPTTPEPAPAPGPLDVPPEARPTPAPPTLLREPDPVGSR